MIKIGIICPSEIAFRRFLPSLKKAKDFEYVGVAIANKEEFAGATDEVLAKERAKAQLFVDNYGGKIFEGYEELISSAEIDAVYLPLPPALHFKWAKLALQNGKHVFLEKPSTCYLKDTEELIALASEKSLALHENYMFVFHKQITELNEIVAKGDQIGKPRLYRIAFGFPRRSLTDFRYNKKLGGGALLDAGGYTMKYAGLLLGETAKVTTAQVNYDPDFEVEIFGTATMVNDEGMTAQLAFGMDNDYHCDIEVWGSKGTLTSGRILTAPVGCVPDYTVKQNQEYNKYYFSEDDAFLKSINRFGVCIENASVRKDNYEVLRRQSTLLQQFREISGLK